MTHSDNRTDQDLFEAASRTLDSIDPRQTTWRQFWGTMYAEHAEFFRRADAPDASPEIKALLDHLLHSAQDSAAFSGWLHCTEDDLMSLPRPVSLSEAERMIGNMEAAMLRLQAEEPARLDPDSFEEEALYFQSIVDESDWPHVYALLKDLHRKFFPGMPV